MSFSPAGGQGRKVPDKGLYDISAEQGTHKREETLVCPVDAELILNIQKCHTLWQTLIIDQIFWTTLEKDKA